MWCHQGVWLGESQLDPGLSKVFGAPGESQGGIQCEGVASDAGRRPHAPWLPGSSQKSQCENEVAVVAAVGLRLPPDPCFQLQYPDHQLGVQPGARGNTQLSATWWGSHASQTILTPGKCCPRPGGNCGKLALRRAGEPGDAVGKPAAPSGQCQSSRGTKHAV